MHPRLFDIYRFTFQCICRQINFYLIGPGDVLEVSVWNEPDLGKKLVVPPDGVISFPLIDPIKVTNLTITALKKAVTKKDFRIYSGCHGHCSAYRD